MDNMDVSPTHPTQSFYLAYHGRGEAKIKSFDSSKKIIYFFNINTQFIKKLLNSDESISNNIL